MPYRRQQNIPPKGIYIGGNSSLALTSMAKGLFHDNIAHLRHPSSSNSVTCNGFPPIPPCQPLNRRGPGAREGCTMPGIMSPCRTVLPTYGPWQRLSKCSRTIPAEFLLFRDICNRKSEGFENVERARCRGC